jgi:hypothetical protein
MLDEYWEEYKRYIIFSFILLTLSIFFIFYFSKDEKMEKNDGLKKEVFIKNKIQNLPSSSIKEKVIRKIPSTKTDENKEIQKQILEKKKDEIIITSTNSNNNRYSIKLISKKKIKNSNTNTKYIVITGTITDGYTEALFPMSINENYIEDTSILSLHIKDNTNTINSTCEGYFLDSLSADFSYHMKIEISNETSECYIVSQSGFIEEDYSKKNKEYVEMKNGIMGVLSDKQKKIENKEKFNKLKISELLEY